MSKTVLRFFDDYWIDVRKGVKRTWYTPVLSGTFDRAGIYPSIAWCPEIGKYQLWYEVMPDFSNDGYRHLALAQSDDGLNWSDDKIVIRGGKQGIHGTCVYRDSYETNGSKLYKACTMGEYVHDKARTPFERPLVVYTSPDGVNWEQEKPKMIYPFSSDTYNCITYNPVFKKYMMYMRASNIDRRIAMMESADLNSWNRPMTVIHPGAVYADENEMVQLYAMWAGWFDGMFLGHLWRFHTQANDTASPKMYGYMDTELVYSYNGVNWMHTTGKPIVERPAPPEFGHTQLNFSGMIETKEKDAWILLSSASRGIHGSSNENKRLYDLMEGKIIRLNFYRIRRDGFCGLDGVGRDGLVITKPFELLKDDLTFNINAPFGQVRFAVTDASSKPIEGFSLDDCQPFTGDDLDVVPRWKNRSIHELTGKRVRIWVELSTAVLYSISATMRPYIYGPQVSVSDPTRVETDEGFTDTFSKF